MVAIAGMLAAAGMVVQGVMAAEQARAAREQAKFQGKVARRNAEQEALLLERDAELADLDAAQESEFLAFDLETQRGLFERKFASTIAQIGASGTEFSGSNLLVAIDQAREAELALDAMRLISERRAAGFKDEAALARFGAESARTAGKFSQDIAKSTRRNISRSLPLTLTAGAVGGAGQLFSTFQGGRGGLSSGRGGGSGGVFSGTGERLQR